MKDVKMTFPFCNASILYSFCLFYFAFLSLSNKRFVTWNVFMPLLQFVSGVMDKADNAYSIRST